MMRMAGILPGAGLCLLITVVAVLLAGFIPLGAVALAILLGILVGNLLRPGAAFGPGITLCEKQLLSLAIALLGLKLDFTLLRALGLRSLLLVVVGLVVTLTTAIIVGRARGLPRSFALLLGIGNGVCGSSAIAATEQLVGARKEEVGLSVAIVNALGTLGIFLLPLLAHTVLNLSDLNSGLMIGNTLQAVGQVVAAGFSVSETAGQTATLIKMTRILMLFPLVLVLIMTLRPAGEGSGGRKARPTVPGFILGFVALSLVPTFGLLPAAWIAVLKHLSHYALVAAMAGIGLRITFASIARGGKSALVAGSMIFAVQILVSGTLVRIFF